MSADCLKLTVYFGERDRVEGQFLADRLLDLFERHGLAVSVLMRGVEGFGGKHQLRTDRLLTLSEDLPLVAVAVDGHERIESALADVQEINFAGLLTVERVRMPDGGGGAPRLSDQLDEATKLTLYIGRGIRVSGRPAYEAAVGMLHDMGVSGATVLLGVDGTIGGSRRRARFFSRNADVPAMVISVGSGERIAAAMPALASSLGEPVMTLERVRVLKRDGERLAEPAELPDAGRGGLDRLQKLMLYSAEQNHFRGRPVHIEAVRRLRGEGAAGATALRGIWGYHGDHEPHGDTFWTMRRRVPTLTVVVDIPSRTPRWFELLDQATPERGLITAEIVPAFRASAPQIPSDGLRLADRRRAGEP